MLEVSKIELYLDYLRNKKKLSVRTVNCYTTDLQQFSDFLNGREQQLTSVNINPISQWNNSGPATCLAELTKDNTSRLLVGADCEAINDFIDHLEHLNYSCVSIARKLATLHGFYVFLLKSGTITSNPAARIQIARNEQRVMPLLTQQEVQLLLEMPDVNSWIGSRDRAIFELLYTTGIRVSELTALTMDKIDFLAERIHITTAGKKRRTVPVPCQTLQSIQHYIQLRNRNFSSNTSETNCPINSQRLFINKYGKALSTRSIRRKMNGYLRQAGIESAAGPNSLRQSFVVNMLSRGTEIHALKDLLGFQSLATTRIYEQFVKPKMEKENVHFEYP